MPVAAVVSTHAPMPGSAVRIGTDANVTALIGRSSRVDANLALDRAEVRGGNRSAAYGILNASEARIVELFRSEEQRKMFLRWVDLSA
ncbi:hypothetical protein [Rhizobium bangladeshense]|uniref:hypothetical protein n=1 Tax=Rhizobium bangladeshense TaxID=1138189 RepID=UPI000A673ED2|nr:hypothetical protein [Rhizobium bangladeshense]